MMALVIAIGWAAGSTDSFVRLVRWPLTAAWRRFWIYRRHWQPLMIISGLGVVAGDEQYIPTLKRVQSAGPVDRVLVRLLPGQDEALWAQHADYLERAFDALRCEIYPDGSHRDRIWLELTRPVSQRAVPRARARRPATH